MFPSSFSVCIPNTSVLACSITFAISVCSLALLAFVNIPLSPVNVAIVTPANISKTIIVVTIVIAILNITGMWKVFTKAGEKGWKCIIPIYNLVILFKISGLSPWIIFGYLAGIIPFVGWIVCFGISVYQCNSLAKSFNKDVGYTIGLLFLPTIFYLILGLGKAEYVGKENFSTASTTYQGDGIVNISENPQNTSQKNNNDDNSEL